MSYIIQVVEPEPRACYTASGRVMSDTFYFSYTNGSMSGSITWRLSRVSAQLLSEDKARSILDTLTRECGNQGRYEMIKSASRSHEPVFTTKTEPLVLRATNELNSSEKALYATPSRDFLLDL